MPIGNLTSQFFANVYLNELDYFVKHQLKAKYYIRYVDDFVILHRDKQVLEEYKHIINEFLKNELKIELHPQKSQIYPLNKGVNFLGFRMFYHYRLLREKNLRKIKRKVEEFNVMKLPEEKRIESFAGWCGYAVWANTYKLRKRISQKILPATSTPIAFKQHL